MAGVTGLPLNDAIAIAVAKMVDDSQTGSREPSHSDIEHEFRRAGLVTADPKQQGVIAGKAKRIRAVLTWAIDNDIGAGERLVYLLLALIKSVGGFRAESPNYVGSEPIENLRVAFRSQGYVLYSDGEIGKVVLEDLTSIEKHRALYAYARRAMRGADDAALLVGTSKDLLEAVAAFVVQQQWGNYSERYSFPMLLGQAFLSLGLATPQTPQQADEPAQKRVERALFELACSINRLRNKEGTGHGRPFLSSVTDDEARLAIEAMGLISEYLLARL